jgi:hypothetical protein
MNMPQLRKKVRFSFEGKNLSLFELKAMILEGESFFKIEKHNNGIHNTKLTIYIDDPATLPCGCGDSDGVKRVIFYNRLDLNKIIPVDLELSLREITLTIADLNKLGYDFTEDDLEFFRGLLAAKETSLGYFGKLENNPYLRDWVLLIEGTDLRITTEQNKAILIEER